MAVVCAVGLCCAGCMGPDLRAAKQPRYRPKEDRVIRTADNKLVQVMKPTTEVSALPLVNPGPSRGAGFRLLQVGDRLEIQIRATLKPENLKGVVDENGNLNLPYIGTIHVAGKSSAEAEKMIEKAYVDGQFYRTITVIIVPPEEEYAVQGEVLKPGSYPIARNLTLTQALARAGRFTDFADTTNLKLIRGPKTLVINIKRIEKGQEQDITIIPGDVIIVQRTWY